MRLVPSEPVSNAYHSVNSPQSASNSLERTAEARTAAAASAPVFEYLVPLMWGAALVFRSFSLSRLGDQFLLVICTSFLSRR